MVKKTQVILCCLMYLFLVMPTAAVSAEVDEDVKAFLNNLEDAINKMNTYKCVMVSEIWKGRRHEKKTLRFQFKKPNLIRTDVLKGKKKGSSVVLNKEGKIRGRNAWGLRKTLKPTDKRLKNIRGFTFMNASLLDKLERLKRHIFQRGGIATVKEEEYIGVPAYHLHIDHKDPDNPITAEDIWFEKKTYFILKNLKYEGDMKVADTTWQDFQINIPLENALFDL